MFLELHYPHYEDSARSVAGGARLVDSTVYSGVSVIPSEVQAVCVRHNDSRDDHRTYFIELTLRGGAKVTVPVFCPLQGSTFRLDYTTKVALSIREQLTQARASA